MIRDSLMLKHQEHFIDIDYFLEEDVENFYLFSESEDFVSEKETMKQLKILEGSTYLGLVYQLANHLQKLPCEIEIWKVSKNADGKLRVCDCVASNTYSRFINSKDYCFFVRFATETDSDIVAQTYEMLELQKKWVEVVRSKYISALPQHLQLLHDPCEGCGIGCGGYILKNYTNVVKSEINQVGDIQLSTDLHEELDSLAQSTNLADISKKKIIHIYQSLVNEATFYLSRSKCAVSENSRLIFFRAYDTENSWHELGIERNSNQIKKVASIQSPSNSESSTESSDENSDEDEDSNIIDNNGESIPNKKTRRIIYLGSSVLNPSSLYQDVSDEFSKLLQQYFGKHNLPLPNKWNFIQFVNMLSSSELQQYEYSPIKQLDINCGDILYCIPIDVSHLNNYGSHGNRGGTHHHNNNLDNENDQQEEEEEEEKNNLDDLVNDAFATNPYVDDIRDFFENETTKITMNIRPHRSFDYVETFNRSTGIWNYAKCPIGTPQMTSNGLNLSLSKTRKCHDIISDIEDYLHFSKENRLLIGKSYTSQNVGPGYRQLRMQINEKNLIH